MKILITGAHGFVGNRLMQDLDDTVAAPSMRSMSEEQIRNMIEKSRADVIIHTAAISDVGTCEKDPGASYEANVRLPLFLAKAAKEQKLICFSSDQVYRGCAGEGPYKEEDWCATRQVDKLNNENFFFPGTVYVPGCLCNVF